MPTSILTCLTANCVSCRSWRARSNRACFRYRPNDTPVFCLKMRLRRLDEMFSEMAIEAMLETFVRPCSAMWLKTAETLHSSWFSLELEGFWGRADMWTSAGTDMGNLLLNRSVAGTLIRREKCNRQ